jgi:UDP-3-O-[3-hydroxymyristoyl] glucosamine N-acyltransferase
MKHLRIFIIKTTLIVCYFMIQSQYTYSNYWCLSEDEAYYKTHLICNKYKSKSDALKNGSCLLNSKAAMDSVSKIIAIGSRKPEYFQGQKYLNQGGGYVEKSVRLNKNQAGESLTYIDSDAQICDNVTLSPSSLILGHPIISGNARIGGNAIISCKAKIMDDAYVTGSAIIQGNAIISGSPLIRDFSIIKGDAKISGSAQIKDKAVIQDKASVTGESIVGKDSVISGDTVIDQINPIAVELKEIIAKNKTNPNCNQNNPNDGTQCFGSSIELTELVFNGLRDKSKSCPSLSQYLVPGLKPIKKTERGK